MANRLSGLFKGRNANQAAADNSATDGPGPNEPVAVGGKMHLEDVSLGVADGPSTLLGSRGEGDAPAPGSDSMSLNFEEIKVTLKDDDALDLGEAADYNSDIGDGTGI